MYFKNKSISRLFHVTAGMHFTFACLAFGIESTPISGDLSAVSFDSPHNIYRVESDIEVPQDKIVRIPAGTIFLFGLEIAFRVNGQLSVEGTDSLPVIFTSINDSLFADTTGTLPSPFDWSGIIISQTAQNVMLNNVQIKYAQRPLSADCSTLTMKGIYRIKTSDDFFIINGEQMKTANNTPFTWSSLPAPPQPPEAIPLPVAPASSPTAPESSMLKVNWRVPTAAGIGIAAVGAGVIGIMRGLCASTAYDSAEMFKTNKYRCDRYYERYKKCYLQSAAAFTFSGLGIGTAVYLYFFYPKKQTGKQAFLAPDIMPSGACGLTMEMRW